MRDVFLSRHSDDVDLTTDASARTGAGDEWGLGRGRNNYSDAENLFIYENNWRSSSAAAEDRTALAHLCVPAIGAGGHHARRQRIATKRTH